MDERILDWCASVIGPCEVLSGSQRHHGRSKVCRLRSPSGHAYLKIHLDPESWGREVHGYEQWAGAFQSAAPQLLAVHARQPLALLLGELPGRALDSLDLPPARQHDAWRAAGSMLARLHGSAHHRGADGQFFGPCDRDGRPVGATAQDAVEYVAAALQRDIDRAERAGLLDRDERAVVRAAQDSTPAFEGERPVACHRDYGPANWLVDSAGSWCGVVDFEFAGWDVRVADFSRYPGWEWYEHPDRVQALFDGYGRSLTAREEEQCRVARTAYALSAITWGTEASYLGFVAEGREALAQLSGLY